MSRSRLIALAATVLAISGGQDPHLDGVPDGPRGGPVEVVHALFVQAQMIEGGRVMFCFPTDVGVPSLIVKVDGKEVRALGSDLKPLKVAELETRLPGYTGVVVIQAKFELPDAFFLKVLHERSVIFALPETMFAPMARASERRRKPGEPSG